MDLSRAFLEAIILEVYDEEWVPTMDYEDIPFSCHKCHEHGHLFRHCPTNNMEGNGKTTWIEIIRVSPRLGAKGKGVNVHTRRLVRANTHDIIVSKS